MTRTPAPRTVQNINPCTPSVVLQLANICKFQKFPLFFINDFIEYQAAKNWIYKGKRIKKPAGAFVKWSNARRERLKNAGLWHGEKLRNWDLTAAVFRGYKTAKDPENEKYIEKLAAKVCNGDNMTEQEEAHALQMGMFKGLEELKEIDNIDYDIRNRKNFDYEIEFICKKCHYRDIGIYGMMFEPNEEKDIFCPNCGKVQKFAFSKLLRQGKNIEHDDLESEDLEQ